MTTPILPPVPQDYEGRLGPVWTRWFELLRNRVLASGGVAAVAPSMAFSTMSEVAATAGVSSFSSATSHAASPGAISWNAAAISQGFEISSDTPTQLLCTAPALYLLQGTAQLRNPATAPDTVSLWLRKNSSPVVDSTVRGTVPAKQAGLDGVTVLGFGCVVECVAGDFIEVFWASVGGVSWVDINPLNGAIPAPGGASARLTITPIPSPA